MTIQEFLELLKSRTDIKWRFAGIAGRQIRCKKMDCPILAIAWDEYTKHLAAKPDLLDTMRVINHGRANSHYYNAARVVGLSYEDAYAIVVAADNSSIGYDIEFTHLRALLEDATGLGMVPWR